MASFLDQYNAIAGPTGYQPLAPSPQSAGSPMNFGGLLFGGMDGGLNDYLSEEQRQAMQRQAMLQSAAALLQSSGRSTTRTSLGQALGQGLAAGAAGYQQAQQGAIAQLLAKQKLDEYKRKQTLQNMLTQGLVGDQAAPTMAAEPQTQFPMAGEVITPMQSQIIGRLPFGPTKDRASLIGQTMPEGFAPPSLPAVSVSAKPRTPQDIFSSLSPQQRLLVASDPESLLPKVFEESMKRESFETVTGQDAADLGLDPRGRYQINNRTNQITTLQAPSDEFRVVTGLQAETYGLNGSSKWQVNTTNRQATLVPSAPGIFGGGIQGDASNIVIDAINSGKTDTVQYALAFRALNMPIPTEEMQADGSMKIVYKQPSPLPASFPQPSFKGKIPAVTKPVVVVPSTGQAAPAPATVTARAPTPAPAPVVSPTEGATAAPLPAGVKSTPMAPRPEEISAARKSINAGVNFVASLNKMENMVREQGMQLGGVGQKGASQEAVYEDLLTKLRLAAELGVLNKEDLPRLQAQLGSPTALSTYIKGLGGPSAFYAQIGELRDRIIQETTNNNLQFGQPIMQLPSTFSVTAPAPIPRATTVAPPPAIRELLELYPAPRKP